MKYFRVHTSDIAWLTKQPRGIFTTVGKLVDSKTLTEEETAEYWKQREYFDGSTDYGYIRLEGY